MDQRPLQARDVIGTWRIMSNSVKTEAAIRTNTTYTSFELIITSNRSFSATGVPPGVFFNATSSATNFTGYCSLTYQGGENCLSLTFTNLPGIMPHESQSGVWSSQIVSFGKLSAVRLGQLDGHSFYMAR